MDNKTILEKAIQKAIDGGFNIVEFGKGHRFERFLTNDEVWNYTQAILMEPAYATELIFSHDFAKALWGKESVYMADCIESPEEGAAGFQENYDAWEFHLREMVIADDPIKYLGENI